MQGTTLQLGKTWKIGEPLGGGGFGQVYAATCDGEQAAAKFVPKRPGAQRELLFVDLGSARNVVPVVDQGQTDNAWVIVMPRADKSLRDLLNETGGAGLGAGAAVGVLTDIAQARCHDGTGYPQVLHDPPYAAPEQWRDERATSSTDVYAIGVIAYELLTGRRPFAGPDTPDFREQHLDETPAPLEGVPVTLAALVTECLYKPAEARPAATDLERRLAGVLVPALHLGCLGCRRRTMLRSASKPRRHVQRHRAVSLPRGYGASAPPSAPEEGASTTPLDRQTTTCRADPMTINEQKSRPPTGNYAALSEQSLEAADSKVPPLPLTREVH